MTSTAVARYRAVFASSCSHDPSRIPRRFLTAFSHGYMTTPLSSAKEGRRSYSSLSHSSMEDSILQKVTVRTISSLYRKGEPITMSTAHDLPSALIADAEMDIVLVGDSLAMVALGKEDTTQVGLEDMIHHCRSVTRGTRKSFTVGDLPMGSYEVSSEQALASSIRLIKEGQVQGVKLEGGVDMAPIIAKIVKAGIPVLGHIGLMPQRFHALGGFKAQGTTCDSAMSVLKDSLALQKADCFAVVLEAIPGQVATVITEKLSIPTIGVGSGSGCSGQGLVQVDLVGQLPHHYSVPKFVKRFGDVWTTAQKAMRRYRDEVKSMQYPTTNHAYSVSDEAIEAFRKAASISK